MTTAANTATTHAITVRPATASDYDAAAHLFQSTMGEAFTLDRGLWEAVCTGNGHRALAARDGDDRVLGISVIVISDRIRLAAGTRRRRFHIDDLIVAPDARQHGIGRALLEHVKEMAAQEAPSYIIVNCQFTNVAARRLYEAAGMGLVRQANDRFEIAFP